MLVNEEVLRSLCKDAGEKREQKARVYKKLGRVEIIDSEYKNSRNFEIKAIVVGQEPYKSYIAIKDGEVEDITCTCEDYYNHYSVCKHTLAAVLHFAEDKMPRAQTEKTQVNRDQYRSFKQMVTSFYNEEVESIEDEEDE